MTSLTTISWTPTSNAKDAITHALFAGRQSDGKRVYVGKVQDESGVFIPSKIIPEENKTFFEHNGIEKSSEKMEYLFHNEGYEWLRSSDGRVVPDAVIVSDNYVGRAEIDGTTVLGKVDLNTKQLVASYYGEILRLNEYDVLVFKPQTNKTIFQQAIKISNGTYKSVYSDVRSDASRYSERYNRENTNSQHKILEMQNKIQSLELDLLNYKNDRKNYEERISFEQQRVQKMTEEMQELRNKNSSFITERSSYDEKLTFETSKISDFELKLKEYMTENSLLLKKVSNLEETLKTERYQLEAYNTKFKGSQSSSSSDSNKIKNFEEKIKNQQQRIFELEIQIENSTVDKDSLLSKLTSYESTIEYQKIQVEGILNKLQNSNADNEYLVQKLSLLTQNLKDYQLEIEKMNKQLQNAKSMIATLTAELGRANSQLSIFQTALSNSYILNGELMTRVSGSRSMAKHMNSFESKYDVLNVKLNSIEASSKSVTYTTPELLEATGSETFLRYIKSSSSVSEDTEFTPYTAIEENSVSVQASESYA